MFSVHVWLCVCMCVRACMCVCVCICILHNKYCNISALLFLKGLYVIEQSTISMHNIMLHMLSND